MLTEKTLHPNKSSKAGRPLCIRDRIGADRLDCLSVIVPTSEAARFLPRCISALGAVGEIIVVDAGSQDATGDVARTLGARVVTTDRGRGQQLAAGAKAARGSWLLFLHADTLLTGNWRTDVAAFIADQNNQQRAGYFRFAVDDASPSARRLERAVALRCKLFALPYGDQGLLMSRVLYDRLGGFKSLPIMEDVDMVRRLGRSAIVGLEAAAVTSADRFRRHGWYRRRWRNASCLALYLAGLPPDRIVRIYERR